MAVPRMRSLHPWHACRWWHARLLAAGVDRGRLGSLGTHRACAQQPDSTGCDRRSLHNEHGGVYIYTQGVAGVGCAHQFHRYTSTAREYSHNPPPARACVHMHSRSPFVVVFVLLAVVASAPAAARSREGTTMRILFLSLEFSSGTFSGNGVYAMSQVRGLHVCGVGLMDRSPQQAGGPNPG